MSQIQLEFPVLIQTIPRIGYVVRPLFLLDPVGEGKKCPMALARLRKQILKQLDHEKIGRSNLANVLWYKFYPADLQFNKMKLEFMAGQRLVSGTFTAVWFEMLGERVGLLPAFQNYFFIAHKGDDGRIRWEERVIEVLQNLFREERKKWGDHVQPQKYMASDGETLTVMQCTVDVRRSKFAAENDPFAFFSSLRGHSDFDGATEIRKVATDLNLLYPSQLMRAFDSDEIIDKLSPVIYGREIVPLVLVGPAGIGKATILHEVIYRYLEKHHDQDQRALPKIWHLDPNRVIAGMSVVGMWQRRFETILEYMLHRLESHNKTDKLLVDNPVALLRIGKSAHNQMTLSSVLKPYLEKRKLQVIAKATPQEWKIVQEKDRRLSDLFYVIRLTEPAPQAAVRIVLKHRLVLEAEKNCQFTMAAIAKIFALHRTYLRQHALPGGVIELFKQIATKFNGGEIATAQVNAHFAAVSHLQSHIFDQEVKLSQEELVTWLSSQLVGQTEAVQALADVVGLIKAGLYDPQKPMATMLFIGPTGVGKTQAAKLLAKYIFESAESLVRFDMNEYVDGDAVNRLVGNFDNPEGQLTGKVRYRPFCVLLLDEIEKAHPQVHDLLLQLLGEGRLSDAAGRTVAFTNTIVLMTSNVGAQDATHQVGFGQTAERVAQSYRQAVERFFRPEFLNRIDKTVVFRNLDLEDIMAIARLQIAELLQREGFIRRMTILNISQNVLAQIARQGFDPQMGGRALKRKMEKELTMLTAEQMIAIQNDKPIIFEVFLHRGSLLPRLTALDRLDAKPNRHLQLPTAEELPGRYSQLMEVLQNMEKNLLAEQEKMGPGPAQSSQWEFYFFKNELLSLKEEVQNRLWGIQEYAQDVTAVFSPQVHWNFHTCDYDRLLDWNDFYTQLQIREYLNELYITGPALVRESQAQFLPIFLKTAYLQFFHKHFVANSHDAVLIQIRCCVENVGEREIKYLEHAYTRLWENLGMAVENYSGTNALCRYFAGKGLGMYELWHPEAGIHMFYLPYAPPVPVQVRVMRISQECDITTITTLVRHDEAAYSIWLEKLAQGDASLNQDPHLPLGNILRLYVLPGDDGADDTVTDIRTGMSNRSDMSVEEWKFLLMNFYMMGIPE